MIGTPICDFVREYARRDPLRLHMPGHKGAARLGPESLDITEIDGADDLFHADGIIAGSEANASRLFGCPTFYSTEGSSLCIRAMLFLAIAGGSGERPLILAGRNAHKTLLNTAAVLDFDIAWLWPPEGSAFHSCAVTAEGLESRLAELDRKPRAVYLTSPDYLGSTADIPALAAVCRRHGILLLVDNAHGAYLKFLPESRHPMDLGADLCCDSAHKTLPVLTGGAYLHISPAHPELAGRAKAALGLFGSTSPSYLILQSLDLCNPYLEQLPGLLKDFLPRTDALRKVLEAAGYTLMGDEPMKLTLDAKARGCTGDDLAAQLAQADIICEFHDPDYTVLMLTPETGEEGLDRIRTALEAIPRRPPLAPAQLPASRPEAVLTPREAVFSPQETLPAEQCLGRIMASAAVSCPPAIPIVMCGERIDEAALARFRYYGTEVCTVTALPETD